MALIEKAMIEALKIDPVFTLERLQQTYKPSDNSTPGELLSAWYQSMAEVKVSTITITPSGS